VGQGHPGDITRKLSQTYRALVEKELE
jgi:hypothetical protein